MRLAPALLLLLGGCSETKFSQLTQEDLFQQNRLNTVDVLIVIDNSCSMIEEQKNLGNNFASFIRIFDEAEVDWQIGVVTTDVLDTENAAGRLIGGDDEIVIADPDARVVDSVAYDRAWPLGPGVVMALDPTWNASAQNDSLDHWCVATAATPGAANDGCGGDGPGVDSRSSVVITEFLADPDTVPDDEGEWVELTNVTAEDIDLSGWILGDRGRNAFVIPDGTTLPAGAAQVFGRTEGVAAGAVATGAEFTLNNHDLFLTRDTEGPAEIFAEMVAQGTSGTGLEMGLEAARLALSEPLLSGENAGFVREEANLSVLVVSDEEDSSPDPVDDYLNDMSWVKGEDAFRDHSRFNLSGVVGDTPPEFDGEPSCSSANGNATYGSRYVYAANATEGLLESICAEDFAPIVENLGLTLSGLIAEFALSRVPDIDSLKVSLYAEADESTKLQDLTLGTEFSYDEVENSLVFDLGFLPDSQQYILAEYRVQSGT